MNNWNLGNRESQNYNENVFKNNLKHAILEQMRAPPEGFTKVVRAHFFYKRDSLIKVIKYESVPEMLGGCIAGTWGPGWEIQLQGNQQAPHWSQDRAYEDKTNIKLISE